MNEFLEVYVYVLMFLVPYYMFTYLINDSSREEMRAAYYKFTAAPYGVTTFWVVTSIFTLIYAAILTLGAWLVRDLIVALLGIL